MARLKSLACVALGAQRLSMPLITKRAPQRKRRSETRLGKVKEADSPTLQMSIVQVQANWRDKLERVPGLMMVGLLCYALFYLFTDARFFVFEAIIVGHNRVSAQEIYRQAQVEGQSIFFINRQDTSSRIEQLPNVKLAKVTCQLPARVQIEVVEREPAYLWQVGQKVYWLDDEGVVMEPRGKSPDTIMFLDADAQIRAPGSRIAPEILEAAQELREWLPAEKVFQWSQSQGLSFKHRDGYPVYLGQVTDLPEKLTTLHALAEDFASKDIRPEFVDLRFAGRPYYR